MRAVAPGGRRVQLWGMRFGRHKWTRAGDYGDSGRKNPSRWVKFLPLWAGALLFGTAYGAGWLPKVVTPDDAGQVAGQADGGPKVVTPSRPGRIVHGSGVSTHFSYCKWGGGTNCVVDGDTFWIGGQKVRIADIDAPETHDYRCRSELELGERAARRLQQLLNSGAVTMTSIDRDRDSYGRLLRNVRVGGQDVGEALVSDGLARWYRGGRRPWC